MAFRDTWHRTLVYFGLAEERDDAYDDELRRRPKARPPLPEPEADDRGSLPRAPERQAADRPAAARRDRRHLRRRRHALAIGARHAHAATSRQRRQAGLAAAGPAGGGGRNGSRSDARVHLVVPQSFNDVKDVADKFKDSIPVIINLQGADSDLVRRLVDFGSGLTYALDGGMQKIADKVFLLTPRNVEVSAEERARILEKGFFNQS
ncbi:MAG: cell division protein SepF [Thermoleophilaceae bacterium]